MFNYHRNEIICDDGTVLILSIDHDIEDTQKKTRILLRMHTDDSKQMIREYILCIAF